MKTKNGKPCPPGYKMPMKPEAAMLGKKGVAMEATGMKPFPPKPFPVKKKPTKKAKG